MHAAAVRCDGEKKLNHVIPARCCVFLRWSVSAGLAARLRAAHMSGVAALTVMLFDRRSSQ